MIRWWQETLYYNLGSKRIRLPHGPGRITQLSVDGERFVKDGLLIKKPEHKRNFKINDRSIFIYPLRYDARIDVVYEVQEMNPEMTLSAMTDLAAKFWIETGKAPTHVMMTSEQQKDLSLTFNPKMKFGVPGTTDDARVSTLHLVPDAPIDVLVVGPAQSGKTYPLKFPKMLRIED